MDTEPRIFYGNVLPKDFANALIGEFNTGNLHTQEIGTDENLIVQISNRSNPSVGGTTVLTIHLRKVKDGVSVSVGRQSWLGVAASLGQTALSTWLNPWNLINKLDDLAQDIESIQLNEKVWQVIENYAHNLGISQELSNRLTNIVCPYCTTGNTLEATSCIGCGAPLGNYRPLTCLNCGFVIKKTDLVCPNCKKELLK